MLKVTEPVGVPWPTTAARTVAVKVTVWLGWAGLAVEVSVVVLALMTFKDIELLLGLNLPLPLYCTITWWSPRPRVLVLYWACPAALSVNDPRLTPSMMNVAVPCGR